MNHFFKVSAALVLLALCSSCNKDCAGVNDPGNPEQLIRLKDGTGNNLWFGSAAQYNPNEVVFEHETEGILASSARESHQAVALEFPLNNTEEEVIYMWLDSVTVDTLSYTTFEYFEECDKIYELSYVNFNGKKVCGSCGDTEFNPDRYINLIKD